MGVLENCKPRQDLLEGNINLDIFTASLSQVANHYKRKKAQTHGIYSDGEQFFSEGTYATYGLKTVLRNVFSRIKGDTTAPSLQRLETSFGGGKTHTLIACTHLAYRGKELASTVLPLLAPFPSDILPEPEEVAVVAMCGDELAVRKNEGTEVRPYGLWDELAFQMGGRELCDELSLYLGKKDAPDEAFFEKVFSGRKALVMIDELAQYVARWNVAYPDAQDMIGSFLMTFLGYARKNPGIAIVVTLAGSSDAFASRTSELKKLLEMESDREVSEEYAASMLQRAASGIASVVSRDESVVVPVHGNELSSVMGKRLFVSIDQEGARSTVDRYVQMYEKNGRYFPEEVQREEYRGVMLGTYPFHPTLIDFLNEKLATLETFQGTRGVLRVLSLAVRSIWKNRLNVPMIHGCHLDFHDVRTADEIIGRTQNNGLLPVLNADIGAPDTENLEGKLSNAQLADEENPHPEGIPMHEYCWRTIFLHSLAGQDQGLDSRIFGLTEQEAFMNISYPLLPPSQVQEALKALDGRAYYLHLKNGRYYASTEPTLNVAISRIRGSITQDQLLTELESKAREMVKDGSMGFAVHNDVTSPGDVPESGDRPQLCMISLRVKDIRPEDFITQKTNNLPRKNQNMVFLLLPETVSVKNTGSDGLLFPEEEERRNRRSMELFEMSKQILAMKKLEGDYQKYGITEKQIRERGLKEQLRAKEQDLRTRLTQSYNRLVIPSGVGIFKVKEIKTAGGEGGEGFVHRIREALMEDMKVFSRSSLDGKGLDIVKQLFLGGKDIAPIEEIRSNFFVNRNWPVLESFDLLEQIIREGVEKGAWGVVGRIDDDTALPEELFSVEAPMPLHVSVGDKGYSLITTEGIKKRGWSKDSGPKKEDVQRKVRDEVLNRGEIRVGQVNKKVTDWRQDADERDVEGSIIDQVLQGNAYLYEASSMQNGAPAALVTKDNVATYTITADTVIITKGKAVEKGWVSLEEDKREISLSLKGSDPLLMDLLRKMPRLYSRGATSVVDCFEINECELPGGGRISLTISDATPKAIQSLRELFETLQGLITPGSDTRGFLEIKSPQDGCPMIEAIGESELGNR